VRSGFYFLAQMSLCRPEFSICNLRFRPKPCSQLQSLIRTALKNNYDVRIAATRVLQAQAQLGITRADQLPSLRAGGNVARQQSPKIGPIPAYEMGQLTASAAYNLDFWGTYRRATEAARASLLANEWAQKEVTATLVA
jgi:multidrug efflux system outer membrane protein